MPISRTYLCEFCGANFKFLHMTRDEPGPDQCPKCGVVFPEEPEEGLALPAVGGSAIGKSVAMVQQSLEAPKYDGAGNFVAKGVTNMNDGLRPGEVAAKPVENIVTQFQRKMGGASWSGGNTSEYIQMSKSGPAAGAGGNLALSAIQANRGRR
jgi:DNA-directed RNA polymerase subunit RPC12/RpoP